MYNVVDHLSKRRKMMGTFFHSLLSSAFRFLGVAFIRLKLCKAQARAVRNIQSVLRQIIEELTSRQCYSSGCTKKVNNFVVVRLLRTLFTTLLFPCLLPSISCIFKICTLHLLDLFALCVEVYVKA